MSAAPALAQVESYQWWSDQIKEPDRWSHVLTYVRELEQHQLHRHDRMRKNVWLYDHSTLIGTTGAQRPPSDRPVIQNVIQSIIDTAVAIICRNRPRVVIMTDRAAFKEQLRARDLERVVEGQFQRLDVYGLGWRMFRDACVFGLGAIKHYTQDGTIVFERTIPDEILVDLEECRSADPRQIHQRRFVDRGVAKAFYPKFADQIDRAHGGDQSDWTSWRRIPRSQIAMVESWHLESKPGAGDGLWTLCIDGATIFERPWTKPRLPFIWYRWSEGITGFFGRGLCEELAGEQLRLNEFNAFERVAQDLVAVPRVLRHVSDAQLKVKMDNEIGQEWMYRINPPTFVTPPAVPPEIYQAKQALIAWMYQKSGVSEMSAKSVKPAGIESGAAIRELADMETGRFAIQSQLYEQAFLDMGRAVIEHMKELGGDAKTIWNARSLVRQIKWSDVDLDEDLYSMTLQPASITSRTPAGRLQAAIELGQAGLLEPSEVRKLLGHPDLTEVLSLEDAAEENIAMTIENIELGAPFRPPSVFQDLALGLKRVHAALLRASDAGAPESVLNDFDIWLQLAAAELAKKSPAPPAGPPGAPGAAPPAPGGPMPGGPNTAAPVAALAPQAMNVQPAP